MMKIHFGKQLSRSERLRDSLPKVPTFRGQFRCPREDHSVTEAATTCKAGGGPGSIPGTSEFFISQVQCGKELFHENLPCQICEVSVHSEEGIECSKKYLLRY